MRVRRAELFARPGGAAVGSVRLDQPVRALRPTGAARAGWQRVRTDTGETGWVREAILAPLRP